MLRVHGRKMANANPQTGNTGVHLRNIRFATKGLNKRLDLLFFRLA